jgi:hypothetical protein
VEIGHQDGGIGRAELGEDLPTGAARRDGLDGVGHHDDGGDGARPFGDGFEHGGAFRAVGEAECRVFDVRAGKNEAIGEDGCADLES